MNKRNKIETFYKTNEVLFDNILDKFIQEVLLPLNLLQYLFLSPKFKIYRNFITFNNYYVYFLSFALLFAITILLLIRLITSNEKLVWFYYSRAFDFFFLPTACCICFCSNLLNTKRNVNIILNIQRVFNELHQKRRESKITKILVWVQVAACITFYARCAVVVIETNISDTVTLLIIFYFDVQVLYATQIISFISSQVNMWLSEFYSIYEMEVNVVGKSIDIVGNKWGKLFSTYRRILSTFQQTKDSFDVFVSIF